MFFTAGKSLCGLATFSFYCYLIYLNNFFESLLAGRKNGTTDFYLPFFAVLCIIRELYVREVEKREEKRYIFDIF